MAHLRYLNSAAMNVFLVLLCILSNGFGTEALQSTMEFTNLADWLWPYNWENGVVPCPGSAVVFPAQLNMGVFLEFGTKAPFNITLPENGELLFDDSAGLKAWNPEVKPHEARCRSLSHDAPELKKKQKYNGTAASWHDPKNWYQINYTYYKPFLHAELVPSSWDSAVLNGENSWKVLVERQVAVKSLNFAGVNATAAQLKQHVESVEGKFSIEYSIENTIDYDEGVLEMLGLDNVIVPDPLIKINEEECHTSGCVSENIDDKAMKFTCLYVTCLPSGKLGCSNAIKPKGHCCSLCGSRITFDGDRSFNYKSFVDSAKARFVVKGVNAQGFNMTDWRMSFLKTSENEDSLRYQFIIASKYENGSDYDHSDVSRIQDIITALLKTTYGVHPATILTEIAIPLSSRNQAAAGWVLFVMLLGFFISGTIATIWWQRRRKAERLGSIATHFVRRLSGDPADDKISLNIAHSGRTARNPYETEEEGYEIKPLSAKLKSFENPSYRGLLKRESEKEIETGAIEMVESGSQDDHIYEDIKDETESATHFVNPLFGIDNK